MKILQINKFFYLKGGSERYLFDVSSLLESAGHEVVHFAMRHPKNVESAYADYFMPHISFERGSKRTPAKALRYMWSREAATHLRKLIADTKPDVAHLHNISHQLTPSILSVLREAQIPVVQTLHDYQLMCPNYKMFTEGSPCERCKPAKYWNAIRYKCVQDSTAASALAALEMALHNRLLHSYERGIDKFIAPSQFMYDKMVEWGWHTEQLTYIPHFVEKKRDARLKRKEQLLYIGRLVEEKGVDVLLDAASSWNKAEILLAGDGPMRQQIEARIKKEGLEHVKLLGHLNTEELDRTIQQSLAIIVPSVWYENGPLTVYESLALGTPAIGSNIGGIPELVSEGTTGYLFEPGNSADLAKKMDLCYSSPLTDLPADPFSSHTHLEKLEAIYAEVSA